MHAQLRALKNPAITARLAGLDRPSLPAQNTQKPVAPVTAAGTLPPVYGDLTGEGVVDLDDILCVLGAFRGDGGECSLANNLPLLLSRADIDPCGGNGVVDLDDILAVLAALQGVNGCPTPSADAGADRFVVEEVPLAFSTPAVSGLTYTWDFGECAPA